MAEFQLGTYDASLAVLYTKGVRYRTVIDLGCADGSFCLETLAIGLLPGAVCVNVDANSLYEPSLKSIQEVVGGHYAIAAVSERDGEIELQTGSHHYWASTLPPDDPYWAGQNRPGAAVKVRALTLDTLVRELKLEPPYLLKMDIQGGELPALRGGRTMLAETDAIVCESAPDEFLSVCAFLKDCNFRFFDFTHAYRVSDGSLAEFYPVFVNKRVKYPKVDAWAEGFGTVVQRMKDRRTEILARNAELLAKLRANVAPAPPA